MLWDQKVRQMHSVFFSFSRMEWTDVWMNGREGLLAWEEGKEFFASPEERLLLGKREGKRQKRVRRRCKGEYRLTMNSQNGCPHLMLTSQRDSLDFPVRQGNRREILTPILFGTFLTDSQRSPIHPATHMLTITYTHIHPHAQTHCLTSQCELFGFKCGLHHFSSLPDFQQITSLRCYLKVLRKKNRFPFFCTVNIY